ncbi:Germin-like protein subfamily 1 member 11 [Cardamine amara subsp. amara]|uniref:Germin-like protein n=1 Tax=Cardamine amara subsp. amara TaxID=228776 RepID=A0ABD1BIK5_CARAN
MVATADDFFFPGLGNPRTPNPLTGFIVTAVNVNNLLGFNTLGISFVCIDYMHLTDRTHLTLIHLPLRFLVVAEGTLLVGFVTSNPENRLFTNTLNEGDVFVFPEGLIHFQVNIGHSHAVAFAGLNSPNPSVITIANTVFGSTPAKDASILARAFQLDS